MQEGSRVALVHDFLVDVRGAERVFLALCDLFPQADLFTAVYDEQGTEGRFAHRTVHTSYLQRLRPSARTFGTLKSAAERPSSSWMSMDEDPQSDKECRFGPGSRDHRSTASHHARPP